MVTAVDQDLTDFSLSLLALIKVIGTVMLPPLSSLWDKLKHSDLTNTLVPHRQNCASTAIIKEAGNWAIQFFDAPVLLPCFIQGRMKQFRAKLPGYR